MKIPIKQLKKYMKFLEKYKTYLGFSDWKILLSTETKETEEYANIDPNIFEKELKIQLSDKFLKELENRQANILFHELVHGKINATKAKIEEYEEIEEEHLANDIVRGFENFGKLEFENEKNVRRTKNTVRKITKR